MRTQVVRYADVFFSLVAVITGKLLIKRHNQTFGFAIVTKIGMNLKADRFVTKMNLRTNDNTFRVFDDPEMTMRCLTVQRVLKRRLGVFGDAKMATALLDRLCLATQK